MPIRLWFQGNHDDLRVAKTLPDSAGQLSICIENLVVSETMPKVWSALRVYSQSAPQLCCPRHRQMHHHSRLYWLLRVNLISQEPKT